jgi:hypothetical protein
MRYLKHISFILLTIPLLAVAQNRLIINNDGFVVIDNSAYVVIENSAANAITTLGTGGNIVSEDETNIVHWEIGAGTGNYIIPWTTNSGVKIPLGVNISAPGVGSGSFNFSTYETTTDMNIPWATGVTDLSNNGVPNGLFVIDRFWLLDTADYFTNPTATISFGYDDAANEMIGTNTITESNLQAQRWNTLTSSWEGLLYGTANTVLNNVSGVAITPASFYPAWTLVDLSSPLPVTLSEFKVICNNELVNISWSTLTEINNDYFTIERSIDGINFEEITTIKGNGNSNSLIKYSWTDDNSIKETAYYRLKQTDFNGVFEYLGIRNVYCETLSGIIIYPNPFENNFTIQLQENITYPASVEIMDYLGRKVYSQVIENATTKIVLDDKVSAGTYFVKVFNQTTQIVERVTKRK